MVHGVYQTRFETAESLKRKAPAVPRHSGWGGLPSLLQDITTALHHPFFASQGSRPSAGIAARLIWSIQPGRQPATAKVFTERGAIPSEPRTARSSVVEHAGPHALNRDSSAIHKVKHVLRSGANPKGAAPAILTGVNSLCVVYRANAAGARHARPYDQRQVICT